MINARLSIAKQLIEAGFKEVDHACFAAIDGRKVIGLANSTQDPTEWPDAVERILRIESLRRAPTWSRYVVILVDSPKTPELALAAAGFSRDVSKCRRIVAFREPDTEMFVLPFLALPAVPAGVGTPGRDLEEVVRRNLASDVTATAFLDEDIATARVQTLAEETKEG